MARGKGFDPSQYTEVKDRLKWYKEDYPDYRIHTEVVSKTDDHGSVIVKATIYKNAEEFEQGILHTTGLAEELRDAGFVNKTSHVENAETSAIGRALANIDYHGSDKRPSKEEMEKVERTKKAKAEPQAEKEPPKVEDPPFDADDYEEIISNFEKPDALVEWFNAELDKRKDSKELDSFKDRYLGLVREKAAELY